MSVWAYPFSMYSFQSSFRAAFWLPRGWLIACQLGYLNRPLWHVFLRILSSLKWHKNGCNLRIGAILGKWCYTRERVFGIHGHFLLVGNLAHCLHQVGFVLTVGTLEMYRTLEPHLFCDLNFKQRHSAWHLLYADRGTTHCVVFSPQSTCLLNILRGRVESSIFVFFVSAGVVKYLDIKQYHL